MSNGCPNNQMPAVNCRPNSTQLGVVPSYGADGYYCNSGSCGFGGGGYSSGTLAGYRTLGDYGSRNGNCCDPQIAALCQPGPAPGPAPGPIVAPGPRPAPGPAPGPIVAPGPRPAPRP